MKNWKKIFVALSIVVVILSCVYAFLLIMAKYILADKLGSAFGRKVSIGQLDLKPPLNLELVDLNIEGVGKIGYVYISPSIPNLLIGRLAFNKVRLVKPVISCERKLSSVTPPAESAPAPEVALKEDKQKQDIPATGNSGLKLVIKSLKIRNGEIYFTDHTSDTQSVMVVIKNIDVNLMNLYTEPVNALVSFELNGRLPWQSGEPDGKISCIGWINPDKRDMSATLVIDGIDAIAFYPYYSNWVDLEKARIDKAKLNFSSEIKGEDNDVFAQCHLELADIVRRARPPEEPQQKAERLTDAVLDMFKAMNQGKVVLDFTLHTKMDHPRFGFDNIKSAFEGKLMQARTNSGLRTQDMLLWPGKILQSGVKSGSDLSKAAIDGVFALGNGMKKFFEDMMDKQTPAN
ncbi:MAG: DUF748 domain-containing protein [Candidatus Omnitrophica bacterium]|nr:DUF748 domain-containing protein [Candidatus Omnitrophota bacterium]